MRKVLSTPKKYILAKLTKEKYINFIEEAIDKKFKFHRVKESHQIKRVKKNIILRHDIDFSLKYAFDMAKIESALNVYATYYIMVDGQFYNILNPENIEYLRLIKNMGHEIGLHFDTSQYEDILHQVKILEAIIEDKIYSIAQHNPLNVGFSKNIFLQYINAYDIPNNVLNIEYISDSGMMWRKHTFQEALLLDKNLYILAHPISWIDNKNDLISIMREVENVEVERIKNSFNKFINGHIPYYKRRLDNP